MGSIFLKSDVKSWPSFNALMGKENRLSVQMLRIQDCQSSISGGGGGRADWSYVNLGFPRGIITPYSSIVLPPPAPPIYSHYSPKICKSFFGILLKIPLIISQFYIFFGVKIGHGRRLESNNIFILACRFIKFYRKSV